MGACVLLLHELSDGDSHYDWLIDPRESPQPGADPDERVLIAFRLTDRIDLALPPRFEAVRMPDHRRLYLTWEGDLGGGRGRVRRLAEGWMRVEQASPAELVIAGRLGEGAGRLRGVPAPPQAPETDSRWLFSTEPADPLV